MTTTRYSIKPLTPAIGAEIGGVDLSQPLSGEQFEEIHQALLQYQVIFLRDQNITLDQQIAFGRNFGELDIHPNTPGPEGYPEILPVHADANSVRISGEVWHSDVSCEPAPPATSILRIYELPETGGDTMFASMYAAYEALSEPMKRFLEPLTAIHDGAPHYRSTNERIGRDDTGKTFPRAEHPVIRTHPETGRKCLFVDQMFTTRIVGLPEIESNAILNMLFKHVERPDFQVRFRWTPNAIACWDNRCAQHMAIWDYFPKTRSGYRVTIKGDRPV